MGWADQESHKKYHVLFEWPLMSYIDPKLTPMTNSFFW